MQICTQKVKAFIKNGAPPDCDNRNDVCLSDSCIFFLVHHLDEYVAWLCLSSDIISWMQFGNVPLHAAAAGNHVEVVQYLLQKKANVTLQNKVGDIFACGRMRCALLLGVKVRMICSALQSDWSEV